MEQRFSEKDPNSEVLGRAIVGLEIFFPILLFLAVLLRVIFQISGFDSSIYSDFFILGLALWLSHNLLKENHYWRLSRSLSENVLGSLPIVAFFGVTHGSWIKIDRDPGFIAVAGKLFTNANQLFFHFLRVPNVAVTQYSQSAVGLGFDQLGDGRTPVQGFPGTIQLYSFLNRFFSVEGFPLLVGVLLAFFSYLLSVSILRQWTKSVLMATLIAYGFFLTIPSLYIFRGTFTESIAILYLLTIVRLLQIFNGRKIREKRRIFELINLVLIFAVLTRADAVLTLWIPTYLYFIIFQI